MHFPTTIILMGRYEYHLDIQNFTFVYSSVALGFVLGATLISLRRRMTELIDIRSAALQFSVLLFAASLAPNAIVFSVLLALVGIASTMLIGSLNSFIQERSPEKFRGRLLGVYLAAFTCGTTLGVILVGVEADQFGPRFPLRVAALAVPAFGFLLLKVNGRRDIVKWVHPGR
jgi:MFS family permease